MTVLVGVDWGDGSYAVCIIDSAGQVLDRFTINHDRQGLGELVSRLRKRHGEIRIAKTPRFRGVARYSYYE